MSQKITPCLWFDDRISEAADYYARVFKGKILDTSKYPDGRMLTANVDILGTTFTLLNGGPNFTFSEAISFYIDCKNQTEVDYYWDTLTADGGAESMCGWVKDKYGVSWQVAPMAALGRTLSGPDAAGRQRAMAAMMKMKKLVIADLEKAYADK
jgi:predicted 3-demethylubiquinone-9 3-methyltransferase (glyoxalase superfamily)